MIVTFKHTKHKILTLEDLDNYIIDKKLIREFKNSSNINIKNILLLDMISTRQLSLLLTKQLTVKSNRNIIWWFEIGYEIDEAKKIVSKLQSDAGKKGGKSLSNEKRNTCIEYYLAKGLNFNEAKIALEKRQTTFSKKKMILQYGETVGLERVQKRNEKWLKSLEDGIGLEDLNNKKIEWLNDTEKIKISQIKRFNTMVKNKRWASLDKYDDFNLYKKLVWNETNKNLHLVENIELRSRDFHLDHKFSIKAGFDNNIIPLYLGSLKNLEIIPAKENSSKKEKCSITLEDLF